MTSSPPFDPTIPSREAADRQQKFACPVCRAKQPAQSECRRCSADLALYIKALGSVEQSRQQLECAKGRGDTQLAAQASAYLRWLIQDFHGQKNGL